MNPTPKNTNRLGRRSSDANLDALFRAWQGLEPPEDFERSVWQRIRGGEATLSDRQIRFGGIRDSLSAHSAWATAIAASIAIMIGVWAGAASARESSGRPTTHPLLHPRTMAGAYVALTSGGRR